VVEDNPDTPVNVDTYDFDYYPSRPDTDVALDDTFVPMDSSELSDLALPFTAPPIAAQGATDDPDNTPIHYETPDYTNDSPEYTNDPVYDESVPQHPETHDETYDDTDNSADTENTENQGANTIYAENQGATYTDADTHSAEDKGAHAEDEGAQAEDKGAQPEPLRPYNLQSRGSATNNSAFNAVIDEPYSDKSYYPP
jgi:hypothetical protein